MFSSRVQDGSPARVGVVGSAHWARTVHVAGARAAGAQVVGVWSRTPGSTQEAADECGVEGVESFETLLEAVDIVTMAVPPFVQADLAVRAARAGRHLLLDKPVATSVATAEEIRNAVREYDVACLVFHTRLFVPEIQEAVEAAARRGLAHGEVNMHYPVMTDPDSPYARNAWRSSDNAAYWELGPHALSSSIPVLGPVTAVTATAQAGQERTVTWTTTHVGGGTCDYSLSTFADPAARPRCSFEFWPAAGDGTAYVLPEPRRPRSETFACAVGELEEAVATGDRTNPRGIDLGVDIVRVLEAAITSADQGEGVYLER